MPSPLHRRASHRRIRIGAALALAIAAAISGVGTAGQATAGTGQTHSWICHPVHGLGELKNGWNLIDPADPSVHIDEAAYAQYLIDGTTVYGKHQVTDPDGTVRFDVYATVEPGVDPQHATADQVSCPGTVVPEHLTVAQTVTTSYDRTYTWSLNKTVDMSDLYLYAPAAAGAHSGTATWSVNASATSSDGNYLVSGSVDVTNDGQSDTAFTLTLDPAVASNIDCASNGTSTASVAAGSDVICTYSASGQLTGGVTATATTDVGTYSDTDTITWGAPTNVYGFNNTITDARVGLNAVAITADTGYSNTFPELFTWAQQPCGNDPETNNASLGSGQTAQATVTIHRQCLVFNADTAWAAQGAAGTYKYNALTNGNWATYVRGPSGSYNLYAGQTNAAGNASVSANGTVTVTLANGFVFAPASSGANVHIQGYANPPSGNPAPGQFAFKKTCTSSPCSPGKVTLANYYGIHLAVGKWVPDPTFGP